MNISNEDIFRILKKNHQRLYTYWEETNGPCIICGHEAANEKDHLPPKVLYPKQIRNDKTYFFTYPVCSNCNRGSSDEDFLLSVLLSIQLNQSSYLNNEEPTDPNLLALHEQMEDHLNNSSLSQYRLKLLKHYLGKDPATGRDAINIDTPPINKTLTKIVKSIYWLHTDGDILQNYNPGWWILRAIDASKINFIEKHLKVSHAILQWEDKFISHYTIGLPESGADGYVLCSLHFYSNKSVKEGMSFFLIAAPATTEIDNRSLFDICVSIHGKPTIAPLMERKHLTNCSTRLGDKTPPSR